MLGEEPHQGGLPGQPVRVTRFGGVNFLHVEGSRLTGVFKSLERGELFRRFHLQNRQNADEIDKAGDNLSVEADSLANLSFARNNDIEAKSSFIGTNDSSLFMCVLRDQVIAFWTSPRVPGVVCEDKYFSTTGR